MLAVTLPFSEYEAIQESEEYIQRSLGVQSISVQPVEKLPDNLKNQDVYPG